MAQLKNTTINDTGFIQLPAGTTAQRPSSPLNGMIRYNSILKIVEWYDNVNSEWYPVSFFPPSATGGSISNITITGVNFRLHTFTSVGNTTFTVTRAGSFEYLIVAGGGSGGNVSRNGCAGGGGGGVLEGTTFLAPGNYTITVGAGGTPVNNGGNSSIDGLITAIGGGRGGSQSGNNPSTGGSGGGGQGAGGSGTPGVLGATGTQGQGFGGGRGWFESARDGGGGGGGASENGGDSQTNRGGIGGAGRASIITGSPQLYAGGGGGSSYSGIRALGGIGGGGRGGRGNLGDRGLNGGDNTGGGGGGWGGSGGSGIVIIRYRTD